MIGVWSGVFVAHLGVRDSLATMTSLRSLAARVRGICLRTILWLLGAAALLGVLSVLTSSFEVVGRVAATTAVTAIAAGLLWPFLSRFDEDKHWRVGAFGVVSVIIAYLLGMPSIWEFGYRGEESAFSGLTVALMMPVGLVAMHFSSAQQTRIAGFFSILLYAASTALFLLAIWSEVDWLWSERLFASGWVLLGFGLLAVVTAIHAGVGDRRHWRWIGFGAASMAAMMCLSEVWNWGSTDEDWIVAVTSIAVVVAHANLAMLAPLRSGQVWWKYATIVAAVVTAASFDADLLLDLGPSRGISTLGRIALASGILASTGTLALLILTRLNRSGTFDSTAGPPTCIELRCPRCGKSRTSPFGVSVCDHCGQELDVTLLATDDATATDD